MVTKKNQSRSFLNHLVFTGIIQGCTANKTQKVSYREVRRNNKQLLTKPVRFNLVVTVGILGVTLSLCAMVAYKGSKSTAPVILNLVIKLR